MISECVESSIDKYGCEVKIINSEDSNNIKTTKAFIQPLRYRDETYMGAKSKNLGQIKGERYLYIGNKDVRLDLYPINTIIQTNMDSFVLKRAQKVYLRNDIFYIWAILQSYVQED